MLVAPLSKPIPSIDVTLITLFSASLIHSRWRVVYQRLISLLLENVCPFHGKTHMSFDLLSLLVLVAFSLAMTLVSEFILFHITLFSSVFGFILIYFSKKWIQRHGFRYLLPSKLNRQETNVFLLLCWSSFC